MTFADDSIKFPVAQTSTLLNDCRSLLNGDLVRNLSPALVSTIALLALLLTAQVSIERATIALVLQNVLIDPLVVYSEMPLLLQPKADLFWALLLPK